jgi:hypothetical protein
LGDLLNGNMRCDTDEAWCLRSSTVSDAGANADVVKWWLEDLGSIRGFGWEKGGCAPCEVSLPFLKRDAG